MKEITLDERRTIQLAMLKEIDLFCRENNIRYTLAYGTLIGAIRHKGFIPWDDDVDIMMPLPDMERFKEIFKSKNIKFCDIETEKNYEYAFPRLSYKPTFRKDGLIGKSYGVNIDLYVLVGMPKDKLEGDNFLNGAYKMLKIKKLLMKIRRYLIKCLPITAIPFLDFWIKKYRDYSLYTNKYTGCPPFYAVSGPPIWKEVYNFDIFENLVNVEFEGCKLLASSRYDQWLKQEYGDYMQLPPKEQQIPYHCGRYYWETE